MLPSEVTPAYAEPLAALHAACFEHGWSAEAFRALLHLPTTVAWVYPTSFLLCSRVCDEMEILTLGVLPAHRQTGEGLRLLTDLFDYAATQNIHHIFLEVATTNTAALALYQKAGFTQSGYRRGYYQTPAGRIDALCLTKEI